MQGLGEEQRDELREAQYAEKLFPDKYKGRRKALIDYYRRVDVATEKWLSADPSRTLNESDPEYAALVNSKPKLEPVHTKKVQREIGKEEATEEVERKLAPKLSELSRKAEEIEYRPKVEGVVQQVNDGIDLVMAEGDSPLAQALKTVKDKPEAAPRFKRHQQIATEEKERAAELTREYFFIAKRLHEFDNSNPVHVELLEFVAEQGKAMLAQPDAVKVRDGKPFLPRDQFARLPAAEQEKHWTFNHRDIAEMLVYQAKDNAEKRLARELALAKELGFEPAKAPDLAVSQKQGGAAPQPINPPKAQPSQAKGPGTDLPPRSTGGAAPAEPIDVVHTLGLRAS